MQNLSKRYQRLSGVSGRGRAVLTARDRVLGRTCVLKYAPAGSDEAAALLDEADRLVDLEHPGIVRWTSTFVRALDVEGAVAVSGFATEWFDGDSIVAVARSWTVEAVVAAMARLLHAVAYLHARRWLHLDIKPENVLATDDRVLLLDLGSARSPLDFGLAGGTLGYSAPEVLRGESPSFAADVYSCGAVLHEMLAGTPAFSAQRPEDRRRMVLEDIRPPIRLIRKDVPRGLAELIDAMLAPQAARRPHTVDDVLVRLRDLGFALPPGAIGAPPFRGRERETIGVEAVLMDEPGARLAVLGPAESGRLRFARRQLYSFARREHRPFFDLSTAVDLVTAMDVLREGLSDAEVVGSVRTPPAAPILLLGRVDALPAQAKSAVMQRSVGFAGVVAWCTESTIGRARPIELQPLSPSDLAAVAEFCVGDPATAMELVERSEGWPGAIVVAAQFAPDDLRTMSGAAGELGRFLASLPDGVPTEVMRCIPPPWSGELKTVLSTSAVRWSADGTLRVRATWAGAVHPDLRAILDPGECEAGADPLWYCLAWHRHGWPDAAAAAYRRIPTDENRTRALTVAHELMAASGDPLARFQWAKSLYAAGSLSRAVAALEVAADETLPEGLDVEWDRLRVAVLRTARDHAGMLALAEARWRATGDEYFGACLLAGWYASGIREQFDQAEAEYSRVAVDRWRWTSRAHVQLERAVALHRWGYPFDTVLASAVAELETRSESLTYVDMDRLACAYERLGQPAASFPWREAAIRHADELGMKRGGVGSRMSLALAETHLGRLSAARSTYLDALSLSRRLTEYDACARACYGLAELELIAGRYRAAETYIDELRERLDARPEPTGTDRLRLLEAWLDLQKGGSELALRSLETIAVGEGSHSFARTRDLILAQARLECGDPTGALAALDWINGESYWLYRTWAQTLRGRAHFALGQAAMRHAVEMVSDSVDPVERPLAGRVLMHAANEDAPPDHLSTRKRWLDRALPWLSGEAGQQAASIRDRVRMASEVTLDGIVELAEAVQDPARFPSVLARIVAETLGAHRVLILLRLPGLGRQVEVRDLSGAEATGIAGEVMQHIRRVDDVWLAHDAFEDPRIREVSATVRTFRIRSLLAVAIPQDDQVIGALYVDDLYRSGRFGDAEIRAFQRLAQAVGKLLRVASGTARPTIGEARHVLGLWTSRAEQAAAIEDAIDRARREAQVNLLITGPTGAGKTWLAKRFATEVLGLSGLEEVVLSRREATMLASTLWGTRRGDFTDAVDKAGVVERAIRENKALFLDEIQSLDDEGQQVLLPLLELPHRRFGSLTGASGRPKGRLHVFLGTNVETARRGWERHFRPDLWYRMSTLHIDLPGLAERGPDAVYRYLEAMFTDSETPSPEEVFDVPALQRVTRHSWPGNLRELEAFAGRARWLYARERRRLSLADLPRCGFESETATPITVAATGDALESVALDTVLSTLSRCAWSQSHAARELGVTKWALRRMLERHDLLDEVRRRREQVN